jgi:very-short-patch-repair endonuclease
MIGFPLVVGTQHVDGSRVEAYAPLCHIEATLSRTEDQRSVALVRDDGPFELNVGALECLGVEREERDAIASSFAASEAVERALTDHQALLEVALELVRAHVDIGSPSLDPGALSPLTDTRGIQNVAVVFAPDRPIYSRALIEELEGMALVPEAELASGALGAILGRVDVPMEEVVPTPSPCVLPSSLTQDRALTASKDRLLSVVTGPPGTGKSQVVVNMVAAALQRGESVCFASKNNQAVEVVFERLAHASPSGHPLRVGARSLRERTAQIVRGALNAPSERHPADVSAKEQWLRLSHELQAVYSTLEERAALNAKLDEVDRRIERERAPLPVPSGASKIQTSWPELTDQLTAAMAAFSKPLGLFGRWKRHMTRLEDAHQAIDELDQLGPNVGEALGSSRWLVEVESKPRRSARPTSRVQSALRSLRASAGLVELRADRADLERQRDELPGDFELDDQLAALNEERVVVGRRLDADAWRRRLGDAPAQARRAAATYADLLNQGKPANQVRSQVSRMIEMFPVWGVTNLSTGTNFPLERGLFDLVIIDEASQCDVASALPLLYRAKRAVVIGDDRQLRHICSLNTARNASLARRWGVDDEDLASLSYRDRSLFGVASSRTGGRTMILDLHFRSHPSIIEFSNRRLYGGLLQVCTSRSRYLTGPALEWRDVAGRTERGPGGRSWLNRAEAAGVVDVLEELDRELGGSQLSFGVVTPYRAQAEVIRQAVTERLRDFEVVVDTAHRFQGDERDVMVLSTVLSGADSEDGRWNFVADPNLLNVAVTRARSRLIVVGDRHACEHSGSLVGDLARYVDGLRRPGFDSPIEMMLADALAVEGVEARTGEVVAGYRLDLAVERGGIRVDVECDGEPFHQDRASDRRRDGAIEAEGWLVKRFSARAIQHDPVGCARVVVDLLTPGGESARSQS